MRVYEEYETPAEKRKAQRTAKPKGGQCTGLARGYLLVFDEDGTTGPGSGCFNALGELMGGRDIGDTPRCITHCTPSRDFLAKHCRKGIPAVWKRVFAAKVKDWIDNYHGKERIKYVHLVRMASSA